MDTPDLLGYSVFYIFENSEVKVQSISWQIPSFCFTRVSDSSYTGRQQQKLSIGGPREAIKPKPNGFPDCEARTSRFPENFSHPRESWERKAEGSSRARGRGSGAYLRGTGEQEHCPSPYREELHSLCLDRSCPEH